MAITGLTKAAKAVGHYVGRKAKNTALRGVVKTVNATNRAGNATADLIRKGLRASDKVESAVYGPIGKATRNASASVIKATRSARPRARETMGQWNARKGIVNKKYTPSEKYYENGKMDKAMNIWKKQGMGKIGNKPKDIDGDFKNRMKSNNINFRDESVRPQYMHEMPNNKPASNFDGKVKGRYAPSTRSQDFNSISSEAIKPIGPRYTRKQVQAGRKVALGAAVTGYAASEYYKAKKNR